MKTWISSLLIALFLLSVPVVLQDMGMNRRRAAGSYKQSTKSQRQRRYAQKRYRQNKRWRYAQRKRRVYARRLAARRAAAKRYRAAKAIRPPDSSKVASRLLKPAVSSKPAIIKPKPITSGPKRETDPWRGALKRTIALSPEGQPVPTEVFPNLARLISSLLEDGEIRVRAGIYEGPAAKGPSERMAYELRNVRVPCWLIGVRHDPKGDPRERDIQLILSSTDDNRTTRYMMAQVPAPPDMEGERSFESVRRQLRELVPESMITSEFKAMTPIRVIVEGTLLFDGWHGVGKPEDPGPIWAKPSTAWELHPVTSITAPMVSGQ